MAITNTGNGTDVQGFLSQLAQQAQQLEQQQYAWGQDQFQKNSDLTGKIVGGYLNNADIARNAAGSALDRYSNLFQPQENNLINEANSYASPDRIKTEMGRAGATAGQAGDQGRQNALRDLQSYGVDPSAGRFGALDRAERAQTAASQVGAMNQARLATEATGRGLRSEAINVGQRYPLNAMNELNTGLNSLAGGINAQLANSRQGSEMLGKPTDYLNSGMSLKYPPMNIAAGFSTKAGGSGGGSGSGGGNGGYGIPTSSPSNPGWAGPSYGAGASGGAGGGGAGGGGGQPDAMIKGNLNFPDNGQGDNTDYSLGNNYSGSQDPGSFNDAYGGDAYGAMGDMWGGGTPAGEAAPAWNDPGQASFGDTYGSGSGGWDEGFDAGGMAGGEMGIPTVTPNMSPSQGRETDDVPARLQVGEFVIPEDTARWKGEEFFQKLIKKSREDKAGAPAKGKMKPALNSAPAFVSR